MEAFAFFGMLGVALCFYGLWRLRTVTRISRWSRTSGTIVRLEEEKRIISQAGGRGAYFVPGVAATYEVDGTKFRTSRFSIHNFTVGMPGEVHELLRGASVGDTVPVYFDPEYPQRSILTRPSHDGAFVALFLGLLLVGIVLTIHWSP